MAQSTGSNLVLPKGTWTGVESHWHIRSQSRSRLKIVNKLLTNTLFTGCYSNRSECFLKICVSSRSRSTSQTPFQTPSKVPYQLDLGKVLTDGKRNRITPAFTFFRINCFNCNRVCFEFSVYPFVFFLPSLAVSRTNPQVLDIGVTPQDWLIEPDWDSANGNTPSGLSPFGDNIFGF